MGAILPENNCTNIDISVTQCDSSKIFLLLYVKQYCECLLDNC